MGQRARRGLHLAGIDRMGVPAPWVPGARAGGAGDRRGYDEGRFFYYLFFSVFGSAGFGGGLYLNLFEGCLCPTNLTWQAARDHMLLPFNRYRRGRCARLLQWDGVLRVLVDAVPLAALF